MATMAERLSKATERGVYKIPEAVAFLEANNVYYTSAQLRYWAKQRKIPSRQAMQGSPVTLSQETLNQLIEGTLPSKAETTEVA